LPCFPATHHRPRSTVPLIIPPMIENLYIAYPVGIIAGLLVIMMVIGGIQAVGHKISPPPEELDFQDPDSVREFVRQASPLQLAWIPLGYLAGPSAGILMAAWIIQENYWILAAVIGLPMLAMGIHMVKKYPGPLWFAVAVILAFPCGAALATLFARQLFATG